MFIARSEYGMFTHINTSYKLFAFVLGGALAIITAMHLIGDNLGNEDLG